MVHYWNLLWDWNSLDSVRAVHSGLEGGALIFFALLILFDVLAHLFEDVNKDRAKKLERIGLFCFGVAVLAEIVAYPYSKRNDELSGNEIHRLSALAERASDDSSIAIDRAKEAKDISSQASMLAQGTRNDVNSIGKEITSVQAHASVLSSKLTGAIRQAEEAGQKADEELHARIKLEAQLAWRTVSPKQAETIRSELALI